MKSKKQLIEEILASKADYVCFGGESDLNIPVKRDDAIADIEGMDEELIGDGNWFECDENGNGI